MTEILDSTDLSASDAIIASAPQSHARATITTPFGAVSRDELIEMALDIAGSLRRRYLHTRSPLVLVMAGDPWTVAALLAAGLVGRVAVMLHPSATSQDIRRAVLTSRATLVLQHAAAPIVLDGGEHAMELRHGLSWTELSADVVPAALEQNETAAPAGSLCHQTSGTSGISRFALRTGSAVLTEMESLRQVLSMTDNDIVLCGSAVSHSYGCVGGLLAPLLAGASVRIVRTPLEAATAMIESEPSIVFGLGPTYASLAAGSYDLSHALRNVRFAFSAGAPLANGLFGHFQRRFGVFIRHDYGTSESGTISLDLATNPDPGSVGEPLSHVEVRLRTPIEIPLEPGEDGEVEVRSPALAKGYLDGGALQPCVDNLGWYRTHDAGSFVERRLRVHRRLRELPVINGQAVYLDHVERIIATMPGVDEAVVSPWVRLKQTHLVAVVATSGCTADDVRVWCLRHLPESWVPDRIVICDHLPRSPAGKILNKYR